MNAKQSWCIAVCLLLFSTVVLSDDPASAKPPRKYPIRTMLGNMYHRFRSNRTSMLLIPPLLRFAYQYGGPLLDRMGSALGLGQGAAQGAAEGAGAIDGLMSAALGNAMNPNAAGGSVGQAGANAAASQLAGQLAGLGSNLNTQGLGGLAPYASGSISGYAGSGFGSASNVLNSGIGGGSGGGIGNALRPSFFKRR